MGKGWENYVADIYGFLTTHPQEVVVSNDNFHLVTKARLSLNTHLSAYGLGRPDF